MAVKVTDVTIAPTATLREAIHLINKNARQFAMVLDENRKLRGVITDGDVRRAILQGIDLDSPATLAMNPKPMTASASEPLQKVYELMAQLEIRQMPLLGKGGVVQGYACLDDLLHPTEHSTPVILMAGGKGERLYPLTKDVPKPMLPVGDKPILGVILERLRAQGFRDVRISVNYLSEIIQNYVKDGFDFGLQVQYIHEDEPLGTAGALATQKGQIEEPFIVMNADLLTRVHLRDLLTFHEQQNALATVGVREHLMQVPFGVVSVSEGYVTELTEKPVHRSMVSAGIYALDPKALDELVIGQYCDMPTLLSSVMHKSMNVAAFPIHESWIDIGRPEDLKQAQQAAQASEDS